MRQVIAKRLTQSKSSTPHAYLSAEFPIDNLLKLRKQLNENLKTKISVNDFIVKASAIALQQVPAVNVIWNPKTSEAVVQKNIDIAVAVAIDNGLITPIVFGANKMGLQEISQTVSTLAQKAKKNTLKPEEFQGGTFTISNLGMFGITHFTAVINPPQASIPSVGGAKQEVVLDSETSKPTTSTKMTVMLNFDSRAIDEETAALFLAELSKVLTSGVAGFV